MVVIEEGCLQITSDKLVSLVQVLKEEYGFSVLSNLTAVDRETSYGLVCHLVRPDDATMCMVQVELDHQTATAPSLTGLWGSANWQEREVYDLLGIKFTGHPNLKRIFLDEDFVGYPLRRDYVMPVRER